FTDGANITNEYYTTRFTITDSDGNYPPATSPAPPSGKNPGQDGKIVSSSTNSTNSTNSAPTSLISGSPTPTSSSSDTSAFYGSSVPVVAGTKTESSNTKPSSVKVTKQSNVGKEAAESKPSITVSGASSLENTRKLIF
ncbi:19924_t:CDS:1, partial [Racocetra fulgida]